MSEKPLAAAAERLKGKPGRPRKPRPEPVTIPPRLLDVTGGARYICIGESAFRNLMGNGTLRRVRIPLPNGGELRKILIDREDLDALVERWKEDGR